MNPGETCETCAYFEESPVMPKEGGCHRYPPTFAWGITPGGPLPQPVASAFPPTKNDVWCGEWKKGSIVKIAKILPMKPGGNGGTKK